MIDFDTAISDVTKLVASVPIPQRLRLAQGLMHLANECLGDGRMYHELLAVPTTEDWDINDPRR